MGAALFGTLREQAPRHEPGVAPQTQPRFPQGPGACVEKINAGGNTVVLVTHEEDIANRARRVIRLRDGVVEADTPKSPRGNLVTA